MSLKDKLDNLTNDGMVDMMHSHWMRYKSVNSLAINANALWQKWLRR